MRWRYDERDDYGRERPTIRYVEGGYRDASTVEVEMQARIAELEDALIGAEVAIRMLAPSGQDVTLATIRRALRREE